jgi:Tfp pilus assembly protein PilO
MDKLLKNLHIIIIAYGVLTAYTAFEDFTLKQEQLERKIPPINSKISKEKKKIKDLENFRNSITEYQDQIGAIKGQIDELRKKLPSDDERTIVLEELKAEASSLNLKEITFKPKYKDEKGVYFANGIEVLGIGTYLQFLIFFERMASSNRIINVKEFAITEPDKKLNRGRFYLVNSRIIIETFEYNENYKPPKPVVVPKKRGKRGKKKG